MIWSSSCIKSRMLVNGNSAEILRLLSKVSKKLKGLDWSIDSIKDNSWWLIVEYEDQEVEDAIVGAIEECNEK